MKWIALFSHTGTEIVNISNKIGQWPDKIITNKPPGSKDLHEGIRDVCYTSSKPSALNYNQLLDGDSIITMHGWMKIIPDSVCKEYKIYNLHPGLITKYPELKGKDPQKRVAESPDEERYSHVGCVIHKATGVVDEGRVIMERSTKNIFHGESKLTTGLHEIAESMWVDFFNLYKSGKLDEVL